MDLRGYVEGYVQKRDLYNGFADSLARAVEMVATPLIFGLVGWWIDGRTHTRPLFSLVLGISVLIYTLWKLAKGYTKNMERETDMVLKKAAHE